MSRQGREFELLVEKIEKTALSDGAKISSPGFLPDRITGENREVDILIEHNIGTTSIKIAIECRDRSNVQDTTWIEQLHTKLRDTKIDRAIAVSKNGFTQPAMEKAKFYNIETRTFGEIKSDLVRSWWLIEHVNLVGRQFTLFSATVSVLDGALFRPKKSNEQLFSRNSDGKTFSLNEIFRDNVANELPDWKELEIDKPIRIKITGEFREQDDWYTITPNDIPLRVSSIDFDAELKLQVIERVPLSRTLRYESGDKIFAETIEFSSPLIRDGALIQLTKTPNKILISIKQK